MPQGINIASTGLTGVSANIVFTPLSGAPVNIGTQTLPYFYSTANPYGSYAITVPQYNTTYTLTVPSLSSPTQDEYTSIIRGLEGGSRYPNAVPVEKWGVYTKEYVRNLSGIQPGNTVYAEGICSDDVDGPKVPGNIGQFGASTTEFLGPFMSGGLAGYPFVGRIGFGAYASHVTASGTLFVSSMPHIGVDKNGVAGKMYRRGQGSYSSDTCGAVRAGIRWVETNLPYDAAPVEADFTVNGDYEAWFLINALWVNRASWYSAGDTMPVKMSKATQLVRDAARQFVLDNLAYAVNNGDQPGTGQPHTTNNVYFCSGTFINTDDAYESYVDVDYFGILNPNTGDWTDMTENYLVGLLA
jgi:hypothetical protein